MEDILSKKYIQLQQCENEEILSELVNGCYLITQEKYDSLSSDEKRVYQYFPFILIEFHLQRTKNHNCHNDNDDDNDDDFEKYNNNNNIHLKPKSVIEDYWINPNLLCLFS